MHLDPVALLRESLDAVQLSDGSHPRIQGLCTAVTPEKPGLL